MSGHSKWHSIKHKKGAADAKRGKIFTKHAKLIAIAARGGGDPDMNPGLRTAIANAKADNVPNSNIDKAVKKGSGEDKDSAVLMELLYEGVGPEGSAFLVEVITDNKNRSVANVKTVFAKNGGEMGGSGSASWMFDKRGMIVVGKGERDLDDLQLMVIDAGAEDMNVEEDYLEVLTEPADLMKTGDALEKKGLDIKNANIVYLAKNEIVLNELEGAKKVLRLVEALEEDDDVSNVYGNFDVPESVLELIEDL